MENDSPEDKLDFGNLHKPILFISIWYKLSSIVTPISKVILYNIIQRKGIITILWHSPDYYYLPILSY